MPFTILSFAPQLLDLYGYERAVFFYRWFAGPFAPGQAASCFTCSSNRSTSNGLEMKASARQSSATFFPRELAEYKMTGICSVCGLDLICKQRTKPSA